MRWLCLFGLVALAGCGGITTKLCGSPGQPCCEGQGCDTGAICGERQVCELCGKEGVQCCQASVCEGALVCTSNVCVPPLSCATQCTLGASRCNGNGVETCIAQGVCPAWAPLANCPSGAICNEANGVADCAESCPGTCTPDTLLCTTEGLRSCRAASPCPVLEGALDDSEWPTCVTGAIVNSDYVWEGPAPFGGNVARLAGDQLNSYWVLDESGNVIHVSLGQWTYELLPVEGQRPKALAFCYGSKLVAVGEAGAVYSRSGGEWSLSNAGTTDDLVDVFCSFDDVWAVTSAGRLFHLPRGGSWSSTLVSPVRGITALAVNVFQGELYLVGAGGLILRCDTTTSPVTCAVEPAPTTAKLLDVDADPIGGGVFAVGEEGTLLERSQSAWHLVSFPRPEKFVAVRAVGVSSAVPTRMSALSSEGSVVTFHLGAPPDIGPAPQPLLTSLMVTATGQQVLGGPTGALWYRRAYDSSVPFDRKGGERPVRGLLTRVARLGAGRLVAVGKGGLRVRRENGAWLSDANGVATLDDLNDLAVRSESEVYAVGAHGAVLVRRWGTWVREAEGLATEELLSVGIDAEHVGAMSTASLFQKDLATGQWSRVELPFQELQQDLALRTSSDGTLRELSIVGAGCLMATFTPGAGWSVIRPCQSAQTEVLSSAVYLPNGDLMAANRDGFFFHRLGSAVEEERAVSFDRASVVDLVVDGANVWAVGDTIRRRVGTAWIDAAPAITEQVFFSAARSEDGLFFVGAEGMVLRRL